MREISSNTHRSVMVNEVLEYLALDAHLNKSVIDATLGYVGHTKAILKSGARVLGIEDDPKTFQEALEIINKLQIANDSRFVKGNFLDIDVLARENGFDQVDGVLFDLGVNTRQLTSSDRGFSFSNPDALLDMRLDSSANSLRASDLLNSLRKDQLISLFKEFDIKQPTRLSNLIVEKRSIERFEHVSDLLAVLDKLSKKDSKINPATKVFMALRIAVNSEIDNLKNALPKAFDLLKPEGRLVVISFHSGEDKISKSFLKDLENKGLGKIVTKRSVRPTNIEIDKNPSARSARLRAIEKI